MPFGGLLTAGAGIVSGVIGGINGSAAGAGDRASASNAVNQAYQQLQAVGLPPDSAKQIIYNQFKQAGILTPELETQINQGPSQAAQATGSAPAQQAQLQALQILQQTGQTGMTPQSQAALNQIRQQVSEDTNAKQQAVQQRFAAQGQGGSGAQLIGELQATQSGANQESTSGNQVGAMAAQNALQAIGQAGTLGGQIQNQQFGEQFQKGQAQDVINQFNTANQLGVQAANIGAQNQAQGYNLQNAQQLGNANTQQANQELLRQNQAANQTWQEQLAQAQGNMNAATGYANTQNAAGSAAGQAAAAPGQAIGAGLTTIGSSLMAPKNTGTGGGTTINFARGTSEVTPSFSRNQTTDYRNGGPVGGHAQVSGDDPRNDTVKAMLSPGEMVVPRSLAKSSFGKKLAKLLELHHEVMDHQKHGDPNNE